MKGVDKMARKRFRKICAVCERTFITTKEDKKTCTMKCSKILRARSGEQRRNDQLCWKCKNATGGCIWSRYLKPIDGWEAKQVKRKDGDMTYKITSCPQFIHD